MTIEIKPFYIESLQNRFKNDLDKGLFNLDKLISSFQGFLRREVSMDEPLKVERFFQKYRTLISANRTPTIALDILSGTKKK